MSTNRTKIWVGTLYQYYYYKNDLIVVLVDNTVDTQIYFHVYFLDIGFKTHAWGANLIWTKSRLCVCKFLVTELQWAIDFHDFVSWNCERKFNISLNLLATFWYLFYSIKSYSEIEVWSLMFDFQYVWKPSLRFW